VKKRLIFLTLALCYLGTLLNLTGCSDANNEHQRLVCEVRSINGGLPVVSAYLDLGSDQADPDDDSYPIDWISVTFHARPYNALITVPPDSPFSHLHITGYDLEWIPNELAGDSGPLLVRYGNINDGMCDIIVPAYTDATVSVLIADRNMKDMPWFIELAQGANRRDSFTANGLLTFYGHETGSQEVITIRAGFVATFIGALASN